MEEVVKATMQRKIIKRWAYFLCPECEVKKTPSATDVFDMPSWSNEWGTKNVAKEGKRKNEE